MNKVGARVAVLTFRAEQDLWYWHYVELGVDALGASARFDKNVSQRSRRTRPWGWCLKSHHAFVGSPSRVEAC